MPGVVCVSGDQTESQHTKPTPETPCRGRRNKPADLDAEIRPVDSAEICSAGSKNNRPSLGKRTARGLARFLIIFWTGGAATLAWQSYGDATREMAASSYPQLGWLALQAQPRVEIPPDLVTPTASATSSSELVAPTAKGGVSRSGSRRAAEARVRG